MHGGNKKRPDGNAPAGCTRRISASGGIGWEVCIPTAIRQLQTKRAFQVKGYRRGLCPWSHWRHKNARALVAKRVYQILLISRNLTWARFWQKSPRFQKADHGTDTINGQGLFYLSNNGGGQVAASKLIDVANAESPMATHTLPRQPEGRLGDTKGPPN